MNTFKKSLVTGVLLLALSLTTACGQDVPNDKNRVPADPVAISTSAAANPTVAPTLIPSTKKADEPVNAPTLSAEEAKKQTAELNEALGGINLDEVMKTASPDVASSFPVTKNDEGVRFALEFYQNLVNKDVWFKARTTGEDWNAILPDANKMTPELALAYENDIKESKVNRIFFVVDGAGHRIDTDASGNKTDLEVVPGQVAPSKWTDIKVNHGISPSGEPYIAVTGVRSMMISTTDGRVASWSDDFSVSVKPLNPEAGTWVIDGIGGNTASKPVVKVLND